MDTHFRVEAHRRGEVCVLVISGELDLAAAPTLTEELERALSSGAQRIVLDLESVDFIDSTGLSVVVRAQQQAVETNQVLGVINPVAQVERLLELTGLAERLALPDDPPA